MSPRVDSSVLKTRVCHRCDNFYKGARYSKICPACVKPSGRISSLGNYKKPLYTRLKTYKKRERMKCELCDADVKELFPCSLSKNVTFDVCIDCKEKRDKKLTT